MKKSESILKISKALIEFRKDVKQPMKDADNPYFKSKYVPLENVVEAIDEVAPSKGLAFTQWALNDEQGRVGVATLLLHDSGEFIEYDPVFMNADKNTPQGAGSLITYLKRYTLSAIFGITSDEDDDGNQATGNGTKKPKQQRQDAGKVELVKNNATVLAKILTANDQPMTQQDVISAYLNGGNLKDVSNEVLVEISNRIKAKIEDYKKRDQAKEQENK